MLNAHTKTNRDRKAFEKYFLALHSRRYEESDLLLKSVKKRLPQLKALLANVWGYEESVFRFYHASFALIAWRNKTRKIVKALRELAPHLKLHLEFEQIVAEGTERDYFKRSRQKDHGRCIVEAYFHAHFMLEMAVRYADLPESIHDRESRQILPIGWAAFLHLYNLYMA
ncbi:MAG: hypothetical protein NTY01_21455 [Verrucomicrobia bacterium]|nr:hypothetical protein [Verrucomicrobiota bacterium]